ncbi:MAG: DNA polymerase III subunit gamma/tau [Oscillospiraceae bacterium]|nr:DNA polymerase III subunit gamma/tau [Oscillospiraceae bacterium]
MYQALYRKWRPKTFSEVVGQEHITATLQRQVAEGKTAHAYLFTGSRGTGKTTCARILAKAVNCLDPRDGAPCCECEACRSIDSGRALDVTELDAASNNGVDQVRALREEAVYTPSVLRKRVYIIDEVHMLSTAAFNALLKILEEPPEHLLFILATTELHKVPATILSRCQRFSFKRILPRDMEKQLLSIAKAESIDLTADGAEILSRMANGALRDALSLLDQCRVAPGTIDSAAVLDVLGLAGSVQTQKLMGCILRRDSGDALALFDELYRGGKDVAALLSELADLGRELTIAKAAPEGGSALLSGMYDRKTLTAMGKDIPLSRLIYLTTAAQQCCAGLSDSIRPRTDGELCLLRMCDESLSGDFAALESRLTRLEDAVKKGVAFAPAPAAPAMAEAAPAQPVPSPAPRPADETPPLPEAPPMPEEPGERVYDVPEEPARPGPPPRKAAERPRQDAAPSPGGTQGDTAIWGRLLDQYKGRLPVNFRVFLNMASGVVSDGVLTVLCNNDFVKTSLDNATVLDVLKQVTEQATGHPIRVALQVGSAPAAPKQAAAKPSARPASAVKRAAEAAPPTPAQTPPWEAPTAEKDPLRELMAQGRDMEHIKIKGE